jgi:nicotinate dehydrogenase subunit A
MVTTEASGMGAQGQHLTVNGTEVTLSVDGDTPLLSVLRDRMDLKGSRIGCTEGYCGACTVLVEGKPVQSCNTPVWSVAGKAVTTIEAADRHPVLGEVQKVFVALQAAQCGYCTNGIMMTLAGLLSQSPRPDRAHILAHLDERHLCRCGVHARVLKAIDRLLAHSEGGLA